MVSGDLKRVDFVSNFVYFVADFLLFPTKSGYDEEIGVTTSMTYVI
jgi:hypothetical protein